MPVFHSPCSPLACPVRNPAIAMTAQQLMVVHNPYATYVCEPDTVIYDLPAIGRALSDF